MGKRLMYLSCGLAGLAGAAYLSSSTAHSQGGVKNLVFLQPTTPGAQQSGHVNLSGILNAGGAITSGNDGLAIIQSTNSSSLSGSAAVRGTSTSTTGITYGVYGTSASTNARGVAGFATATTSAPVGVYGQSSGIGGGAGLYGRNIGTTGTGYGVFAEMSNIAGAAVYGRSNSSTGDVFGVRGLSGSDSGIGVQGEASNAGGDTYGVKGIHVGSLGAGVYGTSAQTWGVWGESNGTSSIAYGVYGRNNSANAAAVYGVNAAATGAAYAGRFSNSTSAGIAVYANNSNAGGSGIGIQGTSAGASGIGVFGSTTSASNVNYGVRGESAGLGGKGVYGVASNTSGAGAGHGVWGQTSSPNGAGVFGRSLSTTGDSAGVEGLSSSTAGVGVLAEASATSGNTFGVKAEVFSHTGRAVAGYADNVNAIGVSGIVTNSSTGIGVYGVGDRGVVGFSGIFGDAVYADGAFVATGTKSFEIDHPQDPLNKKLRHYCTEGQEPLNIYCGIVLTDSKGFAYAALPSYFEEINKDFRYQLTVIDSSDDFVLAKVTQEIAGNRFQIRTSKPGVKVSWQVTGVRDDNYVRIVGAPDVLEKRDHEKGKYLNPEFFGGKHEQSSNYRGNVGVTKKRPKLVGAP